MFVLSVLEAPNTKTNSLCVQKHLAIKLFLILILSEIVDLQYEHNVIAHSKNGRGCIVAQSIKDVTALHTTPVDAQGMH